MQTAIHHCCTKIMIRRCFSHVSNLRAIVGIENVLTSTENPLDILKYTVDWTKTYQGGSLVAFPSSTDQVSSLLKYCSDHKVQVVPQGGNTSLSGGATPINDAELIINMSKMNRIVQVDTDEGVLIAESGCILENLSNVVEKEGFIVPLDLGAKGSCMIGGNVATNAGGLRVFKYGSLHHNLLGLEVVLADGSVLNLLRTLRKDNTGYALRHMFIGSEGSLGIITKVAIQLYPKPKSKNVVMLKVQSFSGIYALLKLVRSEIFEVVSAIEYLDSSSITVLHEAMPEVFQKLEGNNITDTSTTLATDLFVLIEFSSSSSQDSLNNRIVDFLELCLQDTSITDAIIAQNSSQEASLWALRESIPLGLMDLSRVSDEYSVKKLYKYDISFDKVSKMDEIVQRVNDQLSKEGYTTNLNLTTTSSSYQIDGPLFVLCGFGHVGDGNIHLNVLMRSRKGSSDMIAIYQKLLDRIVYKNVVAMNGSVSAEHGIGQLKKNVMLFAKSTQEQSTMKALKKMLDPSNILNPGKIFLTI